MPEFCNKCGGLIKFNYGEMPAQFGIKYCWGHSQKGGCNGKS